MMITYDAAAKLSYGVLTDVFNRGYEGYLVPIQLNENQLRGHIAQNDIDLEASRAAFEDGVPIGLALTGIRGASAWIGGIGVAPEHRDQGIGRRLMQSVIQGARDGGIREVQLEVLTKNDRAYHLYLSLGFAAIRNLLILDRTAAPLESDPSVDVEAVPVENALAYYERFHNEPNPWQRQIPALRYSAPNLAARVAKRGDQVIAYAIGYVTERGISLTDLAFAPGEIDALKSAVMTLHQEQPEAVGRFVNIVENDPAVRVLTSLGYGETMRQYEMVLPI